MISYHKNDLIDQCLVRYYMTFQHTLDTCDYVPEKYNKKILKYIFKNMKRQFSKLDREDKRYLRELKRSLRTGASVDGIFVVGALPDGVVADTNVVEVGGYEGTETVS